MQTVECKCIKCNENLFTDNKMVYYCINEKCDRHGLVTAVYKAVYPSQTKDERI